MRILDKGRFLVAGEPQIMEAYVTQREARERVQDLREQGFNAYVHDLDQELAALTM